MPDIARFPMQPNTRLLFKRCHKFYLVLLYL